MNFLPDYSNPKYPYYQRSMVIPEGMHPPLEYYTHEILVDICCQNVYQFLIKNGVNEVLAKETVFAMAAYINKAFEDELVEYKIAHYFNSDIDNPDLRINTLKSIAQDLPVVASTAAGDSLDGSPICDRGFDFYQEMMNSMREELEEYLLILAT